MAAVYSATAAAQHGPRMPSSAINHRSPAAS